MNHPAALMQAVRQLPPFRAMSSFNPLHRPGPKMTDAKLAARLGYQLSGQPGERR